MSISICHGSKQTYSHIFNGFLDSLLSFLGIGSVFSGLLEAISDLLLCLFQDEIEVLLLKQAESQWAEPEITRTRDDCLLTLDEKRKLTKGPQLATTPQ